MLVFSLFVVYIVPLVACAPILSLNGVTAGGVAIDPLGGELYVSDTNNNRVLRYESIYSLTPDAQPVVIFGVPGFGPSYQIPVQPPTRSSLYGPTGVWVDFEGTLWVADTQNQRVVSFKNASKIATNGSAADSVLGQSSFTSGFSAFCTATTTSICAPSAVFVDQNGTLWVTDSQLSRVISFPNASSLANGAPATGLLGQADFNAQNNQGPSPDSFNQPTAVVGNMLGDLFIADSSNNRVVRCLPVLFCGFFGP